jgi:VP5 protein
MKLYHEKLNTYLVADQFGYFKNKVNGEYDAIGIMNVKYEDHCTVDFCGKKFDVMPKLYKQLLTEAQTLAKIKLCQQHGTPDAKKVLFRGISNHGFFKLLSKEAKVKKTHFNVLLSEPNSNIMTRDETTKRLNYNYSDCILDYISIDSNDSSKYCREVSNIHSIIEHRMLHYAGIGTICKNKKCGITGVPAISNMLNTLATYCKSDFKVECFDLNEDFDDGTPSVSDLTELNEYARKQQIINMEREIQSTSTELYRLSLPKDLSLDQRMLPGITGQYYSKQGDGNSKYSTMTSNNVVSNFTPKRTELKSDSIFD